MAGQLREQLVGFRGWLDAGFLQERITASVHGPHRTAAVPHRHAGLHLQAIGFLIQGIDADQIFRFSLRPLKIASRQLGLDRAFASMDANVSQQSALTFDPRSILAIQYTPRRNLHRDAGFTQGAFRVARFQRGFRTV